VARTKREKLKQRLCSGTTDLRFDDVDAYLRFEGFVLFNRRGSHCTYHHRDGRLLTVVRPHGKRKTCHPDDIRKLVKVLDLC